MYRYLSKKEKLELIRRIKSGESVSRVCREAGISRTILYRWMRDSGPHFAIPLRKSFEGQEASRGKQARMTAKHWKKFPTKIENKIVKTALKNPHFSPKLISKITSVSPHGVWNVLKRNGLNTEQKRQVYIQNYGQSLVRPVDVNYKVTMMRRYEAGEKVASICRDFKISRTLFYRYLKRHKQAEALDKRKALESLRPNGERHWRFVPEAENLVLQVVIEHPEYSAQKISNALFVQTGKKILGNHGVHNLLTRLNLNNYQRRLTASDAAKSKGAIITPAPQVARGWRVPIFGKIPSVSALAPPSSFFKKVLSSKFFIPTLSIIFLGFASSVVLSNLGYGQGIIGKVGILFSFVALFFGMFFFIYSLKYYLTIAVVLSFSRRSEEDKGDRGGNKGAGLKSDLSGIILQRYPFVSIHIASYNEKRVIERLLKAVTSQDYDNYEIIVVDDSNDETSLIIADYISKHSLNIKKTNEDGRTLISADVSKGVTLKHLHRTSRQGFKGGALKEALKHTDPKAEFVMVFDADFIPYPDTIIQFLKYFQSVAGTLDFGLKIENQSSTLNHLSSNIAAVQGYQWHVLNKSENWITRGVRSEYAGSYVIERSGEEIYEGLKQISGSVYMIRREILSSIGWGTSITEDFQLTLKLYEKGYKVVYTPYIQVPAEAVSTIKRLIRQRMRWAEGHSHNIKKMFLRLLFGRWIVKSDSDLQGNNDQFLISNYSNQIPNPNDKNPNLDIGHSDIGNSLGQLGIRSIRNSQKEWIPSPLTLPEKLEFLYLSPYYLQAAFFILGTLSWFIAEVVFKVRLPFWTEIWGWSLVFTNLLALPLMNMVGLFMEESNERDYLGLFSFVALSYIVAPFQGYAAVKGFLAKEEGPWFRTPKTGRITDIFTPGRFSRLLAGIFGLPASKAGRPAISAIAQFAYYIPNSKSTSNNHFDSFTIRPKRNRYIGNIVILSAIILSIFLFSHAERVAQGSLADYPLHTRVEPIGENVSLFSQAVSILNPQAAHAAEEKGVFLASSRTADIQTVIGLGILSGSLCLMIVLFVIRKRRKLLLQVVKTIAVFILILSTFILQWPHILQTNWNPFRLKQAYAVQATIDSTVSATPETNAGNSPSLVFTSDTTGYVFYVDSDGTCVYSKTTNADQASPTWATAVVVDSQTDCIRVNVWYDKWTPGDTGTNIHIATTDIGADDVWYNRLNTSGDSLLLGSSPVSISTDKTNTFTAGAAANSQAITKGTDGDLYIGIHDGGTAGDTSFIKKCTASCDTGSNWADAGTLPIDSANGDQLLLIPLASANIIAIRYDDDLNDVESRVFTDSTSTWDASWTDIDTSVINSVTYDPIFSASVNLLTNSIYLAYTSDNNDFITDDHDVRTAIYTGTWDATTADVVTDGADGTDTALGITGAKIALNQNNNDVYVLYTGRATIGTATSTDVFYRKSTDGMVTWGTRTKVNDAATNDDFYSPLMNIMSNERIYAAWVDDTDDDLFGQTVANLTPPTYDQVVYRWYDNDNATTVTTAKAAQNTNATLASDGEAFRMRFLLHLGGDGAQKNLENLKLQFATKSGGACGIYADLTASTAIAYNNNSTPADGDALTANGSIDPTHGADTIRNQDYEELNNFTNSEVAIAASEDGKWDVALIDNTAPADTTYCFRITKSDSTTITYTVTPEITTVPENPALLLWFGVGLLKFIKKVRRKR